MRKFNVLDDVLISSYRWGDKSNQLLKAKVVDLNSKEVIVKFKFKNKIGYMKLSPYNVFMDKTQVFNRNCKGGGVMRKYNIGDKVMVHDKEISDSSVCHEGIIIDTMMIWMFKKYVIKYSLDGIQRVNKYRKNEIFMDHSTIID